MCNYLLHMIMTGGLKGMSVLLTNMIKWVNADKKSSVITQWVNNKIYSVNHVKRS